MASDIVLITVDCWRHDMLGLMPKLRDRASSPEWNRTDVTTHAASTMWVFPQILASRYHTDVLFVDGPITVENLSLSSDVDPIPALLSDAGYETGAFVASNPNLDYWQSEFDTWRNTVLEPFPNASSFVYEFDYYLHLLLQRPRVSANDIMSQAKQWFRSHDGPRFLWLHLMDLHSPYYPGLRKAIEVGLPDAYTANKRLTRGDKRTLLGASDSEDVVTALERLYEACVERLDNQLDRLISSLPDDAVTVLVGDHGEEFHHGWLEHTRLYDECVRVPLLTRNLSLKNEPSRHLDLAPTLFDSLGRTVPDTWDGRPADGEHQQSYMVEPATSELDVLFVGVRTEEKKVIEHRSLDRPDRIESVEVYDLVDDPMEKEPLDQESENIASLRNDLQVFINDAGVELTQYFSGKETDLSPDVERRLSELGYR